MAPLLQLFFSPSGSLGITTRMSAACCLVVDVGEIAESFRPEASDALGWLVGPVT